MDKSHTILGTDKPSVRERLKNCLVIGGGVGFLGHNLAESLLEQGCSLKVLSNIPIEKIDQRMEFFLGDIQNLADIIAACKGVNTVFHVASIIHSSNLISKEKRDLIHNVNVLGTQNVIKACLECGVERLVYTSSNNVVFDHEIAYGNEHLPYATKFVDIYTKSKVLAEKYVLASNNMSGLLTCALRPGGIYGPGDKTMLPRMVEAMKKGRFLFTIGKSDALGDSIYIENVVQAHILAAMKLEKGSKVAGQAYFISDGEPSNYFVFMRPIVDKLGHKYPNFSISYPLAYGSAFLAEILHYFFKTPRPFLTRMEVMKLALSNYFNIEKAKNELGYIPKVTQKEGIEKSIPYCVDLYKKMELVDKPPLFLRLAIIFGMIALAIFAFREDAYQFISHYLKFPSQHFLIGLFFAAVITHIGEGLYSFKKMRQEGFNVQKREWFTQVLLYGYPSLRLLLKRIKKND